MSCACFIKAFLLIILFTEIAGFSKMFRCNNGKFIQNKYFCDRDEDCGDRSDEAFGCSRSKCGSMSFTCNNGNCVPITARCNTLQDCSDGSDELNCGHELSVENCTLENEKFLCKDKLRCLHFNETCNGDENCFDGSDEDDNCFAYDTDLCHQCPHTCVRTPDGPRCFYNFNNNTFHPLYEDVQECSIFTNNCEQKCIMYHEKVQCSCSEHYKLSRDTQCLSNVSYGLVAVYTTANDIKLFNFTTKEISIIKRNGITTSLTAAHNYVYWSEMWNNRASIFRKEIIEANENKVVIIDQASRITSDVTGIAIDWITGNMYFTASKCLYVCSNANLCTDLKNSSMKIQHIALTPKFGFMFWTQNTEDEYFKAYIFKSAMDGSDEHVLVQNDNHYFKSLVVDEASEKLYWLDTQLARIESIQFDGKNRKIERFDARNVFSFAEFESNTYMTIDFNNTLFSDIPYRNRLFSENFTVENLYVYNPFLQHTKIPNPCSSSPCKGLCLTRPSLTKKLDYTCVCEDFKSTVGSDGHQWCNSSRNSSENEEKHHSTPKIIFSSASTSTPKPKESLMTKTSFDHMASSTSKEHVLDSHPKITSGNGMKIFFVFIIIASFSVGSYFLFKKWKGSRNGDGMKLIFSRKNDNDEL